MRPEELNVALDGDQLVVTGKHSESCEGESVYRLLKRRLIIPGIDSEHLRCRIDERGWLVVEACNPVRPEHGDDMALKIIAD